MVACVICRSPSGAPNSLRVAACSIVSWSARRAKPSAAAPTVERKKSSGAGAAQAVGDRQADAVEAQGRKRMWRDHLDSPRALQARRIRIDHEGGEPLG